MKDPFKYKCKLRKDLTEDELDHVYKLMGLYRVGPDKYEHLLSFEKAETLYLNEYLSEKPVSVPVIY
jgi:hypothetical protein